MTPVLAIVVVVIVINDGADRHCTGRLGQRGC